METEYWSCHKNRVFFFLRDNKNHLLFFRWCGCCVGSYYKLHFPKPSGNMNLFSITTSARTYVRTHKYIIFSRAHTNVLQNNVHVVETHTRIYNIMHTRRTLTPVSRGHNDRGRLVVLVAAALHDYQRCIQQIGNLMKQRESLAWHGALASSPPPRVRFAISYACGGGSALGPFKHRIVLLL